MCSVDEACSIKIDPDIGAVIVGLDGNFNYKKLAIAQGCLLQNPGCEFIAANTDPTFPSKRIVPGGGAMVAAVQTASGKKPIVMGKPSADLLNLIVHEHNINKEHALMIGDRLDTDIKFGQDGGIRTLLVLTGVTHLDEVQSSGITPTYCASSVANLVLSCRKRNQVKPPTQNASS